LQNRFENSTPVEFWGRKFWEKSLSKEKMLALKFYLFCYWNLFCLNCSNILIVSCKNCYFFYLISFLLIFVICCFKIKILTSSFLIFESRIALR
jgi:hypothetical protein